MCVSTRRNERKAVRAQTRLNEANGGDANNAVTADDVDFVQSFKLKCGVCQMKFRKNRANV